MLDGMKRWAMLTAAAVAGLGLSTGCDTPEHMASLKVQEDISRADEHGGDATGESDLAKLQQQFDAAAKDADAAAPIRLLAKARQAQLRFERACLMLGDLHNVESNVLADIGAINQINAQVFQTGSYSKLMAGYDPAKATAALKAKRDQINGAAGAATWSDGNADAAPDAAAAGQLPTLAALTSQIDGFKKQVADAQKQVADLQSQQQAASAKAEEFQRKSESDTGAAAVDDVKKAADARRDAAYAGAQVDTLNANIARAQADMAVAEAQREAFTQAAASLDEQGKLLDTQWQTAQAQIGLAKELQNRLVNGFTGDKVQEAPNLGQISKRLAANVQSANKQRESALTELNGAVSQFNEAVTQAKALRTSLMQSIGARPDGVDAGVYKQLQDTLNPNVFQVQLADATRTAALVAANKAIVENNLARMFDGFTVQRNSPLAVAFNLDAALTAAGMASGDPSQKWAVAGLTEVLGSANVDVPQSLNDVKPQDNIDQLKADADKAFGAAVDAYKPAGGATDVGPEASLRADAMNAGVALTNRAWSAYALSVGNAEAAKNHANDAAAAAETVNDKSLLEAPSPTTQPAGDATATPASSAAQPPAAGGPATQPAAGRRDRDAAGRAVI